MPNNIDYDRVVAYAYEVVEEIKTPVYDNQMTDDDVEDMYEEDDE